MSDDNNHSKIIEAFLNGAKPREHLAKVMGEVLTPRWEPCGDNTRCLSCKGPMERSTTPFQRAFGGSIRCLQCGGRMSFMQYLGNSAFSIERLPDGAPPIYDKEPDEPAIYEQTPEGNGPTKESE